MCVDVLKLSPILFNDKTFHFTILPPWLLGGKSRQKLGTENFHPKLGWKKKTGKNQLSFSAEEWMELPDLAVVVHSVRSSICDKICNLTQNFDTNSPLCALSTPNQPYIYNYNSENAAKDKIGTKFKENFYFFQSELKQKI